MIVKPTAVLDTNVFLSSALRPSSIPGLAVAKALLSARVVASEEYRLELIDVFSRDKFDPYLSSMERTKFLAAVLPQLEPVTVRLHIDICRDQNDNKLLALAVEAKADVLITGDKDLLVLHPFRGIAILTPADYLALALPQP